MNGKPNMQLLFSLLSRYFIPLQCHSLVPTNEQLFLFSLVFSTEQLLHLYKEFEIFSFHFLILCAYCFKYSAPEGQRGGKQKIFAVLSCGLIWVGEYRLYLAIRMTLSF